MVAGSLLYGKRYSAAEYVTAVFVAGGIVLFALVKNSAAVMEKLAAPHAPVGYLLVTLNLALDAYTNSTQDMVRDGALTSMGLSLTAQAILAVTASSRSRNITPLPSPSSSCCI